MNRRGFLASLLSTPVVAVVDPEELIASTRKIFLPSRKIALAGDFDLSQMRYKATERFSYGWTDQRVFGHRLLTSKEFSAIMITELNEMFEKEYAERGDKWKVIYGSGSS